MNDDAKKELNSLIDQLDDLIDQNSSVNPELIQTKLINIRRLLSRGPIQNNNNDIYWEKVPIIRDQMDNIDVHGNR